MPPPVPAHTDCFHRDPQRQPRTPPLSVPRVYRCASSRLAAGTDVQPAPSPPRHPPLPRLSSRSWLGTLAIVRPSLRTSLQRSIASRAVPDDDRRVHAGPSAQPCDVVGELLVRDRAPGRFSLRRECDALGAPSARSAPAPERHIGAASRPGVTPADDASGTHEQSEKRPSAARSKGSVRTASGATSRIAEASPLVHSSDAAV